MGVRMQGKWSLLAMLLALPALAGCSGGRSGGVPAAAVNQHFYSFAPGFRCKTFSPDPAGIPSWTDHVEVKADAVFQWGTRCQDAATPLPADKAGTLRFDADGKALVLAGVRYVQTADPVAEAERNAK